MEIGLRRGSIGCILWACLPPMDHTLARTTFDAGKFYYSGQKVWGARGMFSPFGADFYVFAQVAPSVALHASLNLNDDQPVPIGLAAHNDGPDGVEAVARAYGVNMTSAATDLWIVEAITPTNRSNPQPIAITAPNGAGFTQTIVYESANKDQRIYCITNELPRWVCTQSLSGRFRASGSFDCAAGASRLARPRRCASDRA